MLLMLQMQAPFKTLAWSQIPRVVEKVAETVHFMYHNDNAPGYIRMAEGTTPPRHYKQPLCFVLLPDFFVTQQLLLSSNGVVLFYGNVPPQYLRQVEQLPTVLRPGRGHILPSSVTGGTWPSDVTFEHVKKEKGAGFAEGGDIPDNIKDTAWQFMGQEVPANCGKLVFGTPLVKKVGFDPAAESIHGLLSEGPQNREESEPADQPMSNPYDEPSRRDMLREQIQEALKAERNLLINGEQQRSSPGSPESRGQDVAPPQDEDDPMGEEVVDLWAAEDEEDYVVQQATRSSISASNPWVLYEAGITFIYFCIKTLGLV